MGENVFREEDPDSGNSRDHRVCDSQGWAAKDVRLDHMGWKSTQT